MEKRAVVVGNFIKGAYNCGRVCGVVLWVGKNHIRIQQYDERYGSFIPRDRTINVTRGRISEVFESIQTAS